MNKNYIDVTKKWLNEATPNSHEIIDQMHYEHNGVIYKVDGKNVVLDYSKEEREVAEWLKNTFGGEIKMIPRINNPEGISTPDYFFRGEKWDLKKIYGTSKRTIDAALKQKKKQSNNFIIDISNTDLSVKDINCQINTLFKTSGREWIDKLIIKKNIDLITIYKRKK